MSTNDDKSDDRHMELSRRIYLREIYPELQRHRVRIGFVTGSVVYAPSVFILFCCYLSSLIKVKKGVLSMTAPLPWGVQNRTIKKWSLVESDLKTNDGYP
jgi:hypothetical protein